MANPTAEAFAARMALLASTDFGSSRPALGAAIANGSATPDDMARVASFVTALDAAQKQRADLSAGIFHPTDPQSADLLNSVGESQAIVKRANTTASDAANPKAGNDWLVNTGNTVSRYLANSGDAVFPQPDNFSGKKQAPDGSSNESVFQHIWGGIMTGLNAVGNTAGFAYRWVGKEIGDPITHWEDVHGLGFDTAADRASRMADYSAQQTQQAATMKMLGYNPDSVKDQTAFLWSHGESDFNNLDPVIAKHGRSMVETAVKMFSADTGYGSGGNWQDAVGKYAQQLDADYRNGKITVDQYAQAQADMNSPDFQATYQAVDQSHVSVGRDIARTVVNPETHPDAFKYISGTGDFAFSMLVDPTLVGSKLYKSIKVAKYGVDTLANAPEKLAALYGLPNPVTGELPNKLNPILWRGAQQAQANVDDFLATGANIRAAEAEGDIKKASNLFAQLEARQPTLMPAYQAMMGKRLPATAEELAAAKAAGTTMTLGGDAVHESLAAHGGQTAQDIVNSRAQLAKDSLPMTTGKPLETRQEFVDWLGNQAGLQVMFAGQAPKAVRMLPGLMGPMAEARAGFAARQAAKRGLTLLDDDALAAIGKTMDLSTQAGKVIPDDAGEALKAAFMAAGLEQGARLGGRNSDEWRGFATALSARAEAGVRAITTLLPTNHAIALNSMQAGADIERFARTAMPKAESAFVRYLWEQAPNEAARRQIGKATVNQVAAAMGLTRTTVGREFMDKWNSDFDEAAKVRYAEGDTDVIPDAINGGDRRVAMNMSQLETHLILPSAMEMRQMSAKGAILGFDKPLGDIVARGHSSWFKDAQGDKDVMGGLMRMLASPSLTLRYGLFNNSVTKAAFGMMKLGWLATTSNMLRQYMEEYLGLVGSGQRDALKLGKAAIRQSDDAYKAVSGGASTKWGLSLDNKVHQLVVAAHHLIPSDLRASIKSEADVENAIVKGRLRRVFGDTPLNARQLEGASNAAQRIVRPETAELIGGRAATEAEGGVRDAQAAHAAGIQTTRIGYSKFTGYVDGELEGDSGRKALAARFVQQFMDANEPARRSLAYLMWNRASEDPKFLKSLDEKTIDLMHQYVPVDAKSLAAAKAGKATKVTPPLTDSLKDYVANSDAVGTFRQRAEVLNHDENGFPIQPGNQVAKDAAVERYVHNSVGAVAATVFGRDGKMHAPLVSALLDGKIPSESELAKIKSAHLPEHISRAEFAPVDPGKFAKLGDLADNVAAMATKGFDHVVTNPMARMERKPLYIGNYVKAYEKLQPFEDHLVTNVGMQPEEAKRIADTIAAGMAMHDTIRYIDNPRIASQFSMIAQNYWLFYRAQEDWVRRWARIVKESPEVIRMAHAGIISGQNAGIIHRDQDGALTLSYPGSGAVIDAFLHAANGLGLAGSGGVKLPVVHDLTTKIDYLNPSLMNPAGFSGTPMLSIPFDMLATAIPGSDMLRSQADMAMNGQLGNSKAWWEQFMPTAITRFLQLTPLDGSPDSGASHVGSAAMTAILNATLAGQMGKGGDDVITQDKVTDLKTQTINALIARTFFSFMAPGATSMPELDYTDAKGNLSNPNADFGWKVRGIQDLNSEYKAMIQSFGVQKANVLWAKMHPDKLIIEVGKTSATAKGATMDPTMDSVKWIFDNKQLFDGPYKRVAAYFIPPAPGSFDQTGWNALMEIGARQHKSLTEYYTDIASKNAVTEWYKAKDDYDAQYAHQKAIGGDTKALDDAYASKKASIYADYPVLHQYFNETAARADQRRQSVDTLRQMVSDPTVKLPNLQGVAQMLIVLDNHNARLAAIKGQRGTEATATRDALTNAYQDNMAAIVQKFPGLNDMYQGVFRQLG